MENIDLINYNKFNSPSLCENKEYFVSCNSYCEDLLYLDTNRFDRTTITGLIKNIKTRIKEGSIIFDNIEFENCTFLEDSKYDMSEFKNCTFTNCIFYGWMRWCDFNACNFNNCNLNLSYIRGTTIRKNCLFNDSTINIKKIDKNVWILGKRYAQTYGSNECGF